MEIRRGTIVLISALSFGLFGCQGQSNKQERTQAPLSQKQVGLLVETDQPEQVDAILAQHPNAQVRRLSPAHGLYEFFGVSREDIQRSAANAEIHANEFFNFQPESVPAPNGLKVEGLNACKVARDFPKSVASVLEPQGESETFTLEIGKTVKVSAASSRAAPSFPSQLKTAFVIVPPSSSGLKQTVTLSADAQITANALGAYHIFLVAQDARDVCAIDAIQFIVTANRPFRPAQRIGPVDLGKFTHLRAVNAQESWTRSRGEGVTIAIIDTGVNYNHPLLGPNIALINDQIGYDFVNSDRFPYDDDGHGTHVAGLAAARQTGMAQRARILPIKAMTSLGGDAGTIAAAIQYAVDNGAKIINLSLGMSAPAPHPLLAKAIRYAERNDVLVVVAAGNGDPATGLGLDIDQTPVYPASLPNLNIVSVSASDSINPLAPYSNFGKSGVDVTAPGGFGKDAILSTAFENLEHARFVGMSGTSMATPIVAGIAAQVWALSPSLKATGVKAILLKAGAADEQLKLVTVSGRHLNALEAVELAQPSSRPSFVSF